ncbi:MULTISPECIES: hypothetical protein [Sphingobium]|jgi:hypothetical protein|uniref:Uncharacterized protein n=1 Tax=Sphingobium yanoikuyae TaxID=13690 RepID=A0A9X7UBL9_SPHYA|nr:MULTISPECIES: hypothetical protein [Sphingobium]MBT2245331.1 hypothetical protein [Sphingobium sp. BHU LFT2]MDG2515394.1 hypothetical protein [Sphingobium yanoikuyae]MDH2133117.1 hypothetical protein [Sphingobium yanoikuyae]MDH2149672.1 hypothetical protein [Sphingobium yanoikuyae]MDH2168667.1 hypothetical protein [Sphingobium yanoikuyae]
MDTQDVDYVSERGELHFLAALVDELMRRLMLSGVLSQAELNAIEADVAKRIGNVPRAW